MTPEDRLRNMMARARGDEGVTESQWETFAPSARRSLRIQRMVAGGVALLVLGVAIVGGAALFGDFGRNEKGVPPAGSKSPSPQETPSPPPSEATVAPTGLEMDPPPELVETEIWLVDPMNKTLSWGTRLVPGGDSLENALEALLAGPVASDREIGITTEIPEGTELLGTKVVDGTATIDLSKNFLDAGLGEKTQRLRRAQIVFTATQFQGINSVRLLVEGEEESHPYLEGVSKPPQTRNYFDDVAPPIVVKTPKMFESVQSPLMLSGSADVFEGTVSYELSAQAEPISPQGTYAIEGFTTASGIGIFDTLIVFDVDQPTSATLTVYESSAEDGSRLHTVSFPITLLPD